MHCLSLYLTPPPQVLLHSLYGPNTLQPPFTGVTVLLPSMHCPRTQIYHHKIILLAIYCVLLHTLVDPQLVPSAGGTFLVVQDPPLGWHHKREHTS